MILAFLFAAGAGFASPPDCAEALDGRLLSAEGLTLPESARREVAHIDEKLRALSNEKWILVETLKGLKGDSRRSPRRRLRRAQAAIDAYGARRSELMPAERLDRQQLAKERLREALAATPKLAEAFADEVARQWIQRWPARISLLFGSASREPSAADIANASQVVEYYVKAGRVVLLDQTSKLTRHLLALAPGHVVALGSDPQASPPEQSLILRSPYDTLKVFSGSEYTFGTADNSLAMALAVGDHSVHLIANTHRPRSTLLAWERDLPFDRDWELGLRYMNASSRFQFAGAAAPGALRVEDIPLRTRYETRPWVPVDWQKLDDEELLDAVRNANRMFLGLEASRGPKAVVFGTGRSSVPVMMMVFLIAQELGRQGIGVATGGAGGAMHAANLGALTSGVPSLGIPIIGARAPRGEQANETQHTQTIPAASYRERIPWLLNGRELVLVAPGGMGTMRELAAALIWLAQPANQTAKLKLINGKYYDYLLKFLKWYELDHDFLSRITVVEGPEDFWPSPKRLVGVQSLSAGD